MLHDCKNKKLFVHQAHNDSVACYGQVQAEMGYIEDLSRVKPEEDGAAPPMATSTSKTSATKKTFDIFNVSSRKKKQPPKFKIGEGVIGFWPTDQGWYPGVVKQVTSRGESVKYTVFFDDGDRKSEMTEDEIHGLTTDEAKEILAIQNREDLAAEETALIAAESAAVNEAGGSNPPAEPVEDYISRASQARKERIASSSTYTFAMWVKEKNASKSAAASAAVGKEVQMPSKITKASSIPSDSNDAVDESETSDNEGRAGKDVSDEVDLVDENWKIADKLEELKVKVSECSNAACKVTYIPKPDSKRSDVWQKGVVVDCISNITNEKETLWLCAASETCFDNSVNAMQGSAHPRTYNSVINFR